MFNLLRRAILEQFTGSARRIQRDAHITGIVQELRNRVVGRHQTDTPCTDNGSRKLHSQSTHKHLQSLHAAKQDRLKQLAKHIKRLQNKIDIQQSDLARCESAERFKAEGDLLAANLWQLEKGAEEVLLPSFDDPQQLIRVELDPSLTPQENVQRRYGRYAKARKAREQIAEQLTANREELAYAGSIRQALLFAESEEELAEPRREMVAAGYIAAKKENRKTAAKAAAKTPPLPPRSFVTAEGFSVLIGRNNRQNDRLSLKQAAAGDIWLHAHEIPGSHVIIRTEGREAPESAVLAAAAWAAWFSQGREADRVDVDVLPAEKMRKPAGSRPGCVIYTVSGAGRDFSITQQGKFTELTVGAQTADPVQQAKAEETAAIFMEAGIQCKAVEDVAAAIWTKYVLNCAYNVATARWGCPIGGIKADESRMEDCRALLTESWQVGVAAGVNLPAELPEKQLRRISKTSDDSDSSLGRDFAAKREGELEVFCGDVIRMAAELGTEVPMTQKYYDALKEIASRF